MATVVGRSLLGERMELAEFMRDTTFRRRKKFGQLLSVDPEGDEAGRVGDKKRNLALRGLEYGSC